MGGDGSGGGVGVVGDVGGGTCSCLGIKQVSTNDNRTFSGSRANINLSARQANIEHSVTWIVSDFSEHRRPLAASDTTGERKMHAQTTGDLSMRRRGHTAAGDATNEENRRRKPP